jgi:O-antigen/teichoic acid export membrane protein
VSVLSENSIKKTISPELSEGHRTALNLVATLMSSAVGMLLSFFVTPYVVRTCGNAYGFVGLANNFVGYISIVTIAINSMASRFVTIAIRNNDYDKAGRYFKTIFISDLIISLVLLIPSIFAIIFLDKVLVVSPDYLSDVRILWALIILGFILSVILSVYSIAYFVTNKLYLSNRRQIGQIITRAIITVTLFTCLYPHIYYIGIAVFVSTMYVLAYNVYSTRNLLPEITLRKSRFDLSLLKEVLGSGLWNSFSSLSAMLLSSLDLLIINLFVLNGDAVMTTVAVAKSLISLVDSFYGSVSVIFTPTMTFAYARQDKVAIGKNLEHSIKILGMFISIPILFILLYSKEFFQVYVPTQNAVQLNNLALLISLTFVFISPFNAFDNVFIVVNRVKEYAIVLFITSVLSLATMFVLLTVVPEEYKMYVVCGCSVVFIIVKGLTYIPFRVAKFTGQKRFYYHKFLVKHWLALGGLWVLFYLSKYFFTPSGWIQLIVALCCVTVAAFAVNYFLILDKTDRQNVKRIAVGFIKR